jgi:catalase
MANTGGSPFSNPIQAATAALGKSGIADPRPVQRASFFQGANAGPAETASMISGVTEGGKREDDGPYFTNNEGIPFPDP